MALQNTDLLIVQRNQQSYKMPASEILNIIPPAATVGNGTITIVQPGTTNQTFTVNQSGPTTITLKNDNTNTTYSAGNGLTLSGTTFNVGAGTGITVAADTVGIANGGVGTTQLADNSVNASKLNVSGNGTAGQALLSDGDGTFSWGDASGGAKYIQDTAPSSSSSSAGELWFNTAEGRLYTFYNDGNTSQWVDASPDGYSYSDSDVDAHLNKSSAGTGQILSWNGTDYDWIEPPTPDAGGGDTIAASAFGTGRGSISKSMNVASIADQGNNRYLVTFTNAMSSANYSVVGSTGTTQANGQFFMIGARDEPNKFAQTTTQFQYLCVMDNGDIGAVPFQWSFIVVD